MIYIQTNEDGLVILRHNQPELLSDKQKQNGLLVDFIPEPENNPDKLSQLYYKDDKFYYEYFDRPLSNEELIQQQGIMIADLTFQLMMKGVL